MGKKKTKAEPTLESISTQPSTVPNPLQPDAKPKAAAASIPLLRFVARGRGILQGFGGPDWKSCEDYALPASDEADVCFTPDGTMLVAADHNAGVVNMFDSTTGELKQSIAEPKVINLHISPKGSYLVTMRRLEKDDTPNMAVWDLASGQEMKRLLQSRWPAILWTADEGVCLRITNNGLQAMNGQTINDHDASKLDNAKIDTISLSPSLPPYLAVFTKQAKGQPAHVKVYKAPNLKEELVQKSMFKADSCLIFWNSQGTAAILNCKTDQDTTGRSYYGESLLYLLLPKQKEAMNITVGKAGEQVHDVAWSANGSEFIVISGAMPSNRASLFNMKAEMLFDFGASPRNTVAWAPNSRFIALCGFGNLAGEIQFWDRWRLEKGSGKIGTCTMNACTEFAWAPDSRHFLCAVTAPRMKVGNKITVFKHNGVEVFTVPFPNELYQVAFKPEKAKLFPNRDPSPPPAEHKAQQAAATPALFKARGSSGLSDMLRRQREGGEGGTGRLSDNYVPGMPPPKPAGKKAPNPKPKAAAQ